MNVKEKLKQYSDAVTEIKHLKNKLNKIRSRVNLFSVVEESAKHPPFQKHVITICHTNPSKYKTYLYYESLLKSRYEKLSILKLEIEKFIDDLPTPRLRMIFEFRYIEQCSWQQVAWKIGGNSTENSVRMEHDRFLNNR